MNNFADLVIEVKKEKDHLISLGKSPRSVVIDEGFFNDIKEKDQSRVKLDHWGARYALKALTCLDVTLVIGMTSKWYVGF